MELGIKPTIDIVFKALFGDENHADLTRHFLNDILAEIGRPKAASLSILNPFRAGHFLEDKDAVLDIRAEDERGREFQIEIQMRSFSELPQRMLHNWSSLYLAHLRKGGSYRALRPLISVWILDRRFFADDTWLHIFELRDGATGRILHEDLTIVTIELEQWARLMEKPLASTLKTGVGRWLHFLRTAQDVDPERPPAEFTSEEFREALGIMAAFTKSEARRDLYRRRFEFLATQASIEQEAEERGLAKGLATAKLEDAKRLKALGVAIDIIVQATGLPREEVEGV